MHSAVRRAIADTGAQVNVVDVDTIRGMGLDAGSLIPTRTKIKGVAAGSRLDLLGVVFLDVRAVGPPQVEATVPQMFYVALNTKSVYISHQCMVDIGVISPEFPRPGEAFQPDKVAAVVAETQETLVPTEECTYEGIGHCSCPIRKLPPTEPVQLPCALTEENIPQLEQLITQRYRASAFNTCTRQKIPTPEIRAETYLVRWFFGSICLSLLTGHWSSHRDGSWLGYCWTCGYHMRGSLG